MKQGTRWSHRGQQSESGGASPWRHFDRCRVASQLWSALRDVASQRCLRTLIESSNSGGRSINNIVTHHSECCQLVQSLKDLQWVRQKKVFIHAWHIFNNGRYSRQFGLQTFKREKIPKPQTFQFSSIFQRVRHFQRVFTFLTQANCLENQRQSTENQLSGNSAFHKNLLVELLTIFVFLCWNFDNWSQNDYMR